MNHKKLAFTAMVTFVVLLSCSNEIRNIAENSTNTIVIPPAEVNPIDISNDGFDFLAKMQGHWVGKNRVMADDYDWFSFDYRAISPSHVHGIFEGGSMGNLFTSFFVTNYKNKRTIMARNGGVLNGIYRTSYFVLDKIEESNNGKYFRFVDAKGATDVMYMELRFKQDSLYFNAYTSRLGQTMPPTRHMTFKGKKRNTQLSNIAAQTIGFPQNQVARDFSNGFNEDFLYVSPGDPEAKSASFLAQSNNDASVFELAELAGDPFIITDHPHLGYLQLDIVRNASIQGKRLFVFLSEEALTDNSGYYTGQEAFNSVLLFPELIGTQDQFLFTYLHPGTYHVTVIADVNDDGLISAGDFTHSDKVITIDPLGEHQITIDNITIQN